MTRINRRVFSPQQKGLEVEETPDVFERFIGVITPAKKAAKTDAGKTPKG